MQALSDLFGMLARRPTARHQAIRLPAADRGPAPEEGYFQVRLSEMYLSDERRWHQEIAPAALIIGEFAYNGERVRRPYFISNESIGQLMPGMDARKLRVRFNDVMVIGPTPYTGGEVELFVGLFQATIDDRLSAMFKLLDTLFGKLPGGAAIASSLAIAGELLPAVFKCLGASNISCLMAEKRPLASDRLPENVYLAYLRNRDGDVDTNALEVHDGMLKRRCAGALAAVDNLDYCLIEVQCHALRSDWQQLPFHALWRRISQHTALGQHAQAQALMLECAGQVAQSPDLTESHKIALIKSYRAKLLQLRGELEPEPDGPAHRGGIENGVHAMSVRIRESGDFRADQRSGVIAEIGRLASQLSGDGFDEAIERAIRATPKATAAQTADLLRTLALATVAQDDGAP